MLATPYIYAASSSSSESLPGFHQFSNVYVDCDIEADDEELVAFRCRNVTQVLRQSVDTEDVERSQNPNDSHIEGTIIPENLPFMGRPDYLVNINGDTHLDYITLIL